MVRGGSNLSGLWPPFAEAVQYLLQWADYMGLEPLVTEGYRDEATQARYYAQGRTTKGPIITKARPGESAHNYGLAADVTSAYGYGTPQARAIHEMAQQLGFGTISWDEPHVEWPGWRALLR